jgi:hypothetical protein
MWVTRLTYHPHLRSYAADPPSDAYLEYLLGKEYPYVELSVPYLRREATATVSIDPTHVCSGHSVMMLRSNAK